MAGQRVGRSSRERRVAAVYLPVGKVAALIARLGVAAISLGLARRRAVRGFKAGLREMGVPDQAIEELARVFLRFSLSGMGPRGRSVER